MYHRRLKIFVALCICVLLVALVRLATLQVFNVEQARRQTELLRVLPPETLATVRGKILDRNDRTLALDRPAFSLYISYELTRHADPRWQEGHILRRLTQDTPRPQVEAKLQERWAQSVRMLQDAVELAAHLGGVQREEIEARIEGINDRIWELARYIWWRRQHPEASMAEYRQQRETISPVQIVQVDLREMEEFYPLIELPDEQALLNAQLELIHFEGLSLRPEAQRAYPYATAACQILGWVAPGRAEEMQLFEDDEYRRYLEGEVLGKDGLEKAYEPVLRGRRGRVVYDKDGNELSRTDPEYGTNVRLTLDIELQQQIERLLQNPQTNPNASSPCAAAVLDGATNDILALVSTPVFDLNTIRRDYGRLINDPQQALLNRALESNYPPGSTAKPLVLLFGLEEGVIQPNEIISCPITNPPAGWPRCLLQRQGSCHDWRWENEGGNIARNAIRGSCNVYFAQLAHRLSGRTLQSWFFKLGFGQDILKLDYPGDFLEANPQFANLKPRIRQAHGSLVAGIQTQPADSPDDLPPLVDWERKFWGIGQGNLRATVLQAANALAAVARNGIYKSPRLVFDETDWFNEQYQRRLSLSDRSLQTVRDGMAAVVNKPGGSAYRIFHDSELFRRGLKIYGKTGSTERPEHAWFECFAEDQAGRIIIAVVLVEGGSRGSDDAAPLGHSILTLCNEAGYIGNRPAETPAPPAG